MLSELINTLQGGVASYGKQVSYLGDRNGLLYFMALQHPLH